MNPNVRTPKSVYITLAGGFALGAVCMAGVYNGAMVNRAVAAPQNVAKPTLAAVSTLENMNELRILDASFKSLAKFVGPAVVDIKATSKREMTPDGIRLPQSSGEGSGFIVRADGYIVTNDHVVGTADTVTVTLKDGREFQGKVIHANDINSDIALVKIEGTDLPYLAFADSAQVEPGQFAMAVGAPFGLENTVTVGHISALGRSDQQIGNRLYTDLIQTDTPINMGNSGGPLVNVEGQIIGMNTAIYSPTGGSNGIGFAIPSNQVKLITDLLINKGKLTRSMLGVVPQDVKEYERTKVGSTLANGGARVGRVVGEPAKSAGIQPDDVIVKIGTTDIRGQLDLRNAMLAYPPNTTVPVELIRDGKRVTLQVKLVPYKTPELPSAPGGQNGRPFFRFDPFNQSPRANPFDEKEDDVPPVREGKAQLGVQAQDADETLRNQFDIPSNVNGAVIVGVMPGSVAAKVGIEPGDVVLSVAGKPVAKAQDLRDAIAGIKWGDVVKVKIVHFDGKTRLETERDIKF